MEDVVVVSDELELLDESSVLAQEKMMVQRVLTIQPPLRPPQAMPVKPKEAPAGMSAFFQLQL